MKSGNSTQRTQVGILGAHTSYAALTLFMSTFLVAEVFSILDEDAAAIALFFAIWFATLFASFAVNSYIIKRNSRVWGIRIAAVLIVFSVFLVFLFRDELSVYYLLFAATYGFAEGIYWSSILTLTSQTLAGSKMHSYLVWEQVVNASAKIIFPFTLGAVIEFVSFGIAALLIIAVGIILIAFTLLLSEQKTKEHKLSMHKFFGMVEKQQIKKPIIQGFIMQAFYDFTRRVSLCITLLIVIVYHDSFSLGILTSVFAGAAILVITLYKAVRSERFKTFLHYSACAAPLLSAIGLLFAVNPLILIIFQAGYQGIGCIMRLECDRMRMNTMLDLGQEKFHTEWLLLTEFGYFVLRMAAMGLIAACYFIDGYLFQVFVVLLTLTALIIGILNRRWQNKYSLQKQADML